MTFNAAVGSGTALASFAVNSTSLFTNAAAAPITVAGAGAISITADDVSFAAAISTVSGPITIQPVTAAQPIFLSNAGAGLNISAAELGQLSTTGTVTIGSLAGTGAINIGGTAPINLGAKTFDMVIQSNGGAASFNGGVGNTLTVAAGHNLSFALVGGNITRAGVATNDIVVTGVGVLAFTSAGAVGAPLFVSALSLGVSTVGSLNISDSVSLTVSGAINAIGVAQITVTGANSLLVSFGITSTGASLTSGSAGLTIAAGVTVNADATILVNGGAGPIQLNTSTLSTTNNTAAAVTVRAATTVALGTITALQPLAVTTIGVGLDVTNAVTQNVAISVTQLAGSTTSTVNLPLANPISKVGPFTSGGAMTITSNGALIIAGTLASGGLTSPSMQPGSRSTRQVLR